nr:PEP-CTERM sorting domain-containing protein [Herbaspirillum sp. ASV7]
MKKIFATLAVSAASLIATSAFAAPVNLVTNGGFENITNGAGKFNTSSGGLAGTTVATGWTSTGYAFIFTPGSADTTGAGPGHLKLWGPGDGSNNGLTGSPTGGNFLASDGVYQIGAIQQIINGLVIGQSYQLSFDWAGAQQYGFTGPTTEGWQVSLGAQTFNTPTISNVNHGFTGWRNQTFTFTATGVSEVLSFLATGSPNGLPPFSLLDSVSLVAVPEPGSVPMMAIGALALAAVVARRRRQSQR